MVTGWVGTVPTFADNGLPDIGSSYSDYYPITVGNPPRSAAADNVTFQARPSIAECDPRQPNAASLRGLQVLMGDGSVRSINYAAGNQVFNGTTLLEALASRGGEEQLPPDF